jgi:hypothetical protein
MKPSEELHKLIKSMTKAEKIYFKRYSKRHVIGEENKYVQLFDAIENQSVRYDESKLLKTFSGKKFTRQIHVAKNYLYELILKALAEFYSGSNDEFILYDNIKKIRLLIKKDLLKPADKLLNKTMKAAIQQNNNEIIYLLYDIESDLPVSGYTLKHLKRVEKIKENKLLAIKRLENTSQYKALSSSLNLLTARWSYSRNPHDTNEIKLFLANPLLENEENAFGFEARNLLYLIKSKIYRFLLDDVNALHYRKKGVDLMEEFPEVIEKYPEKYAGRLFDFISFCQGTEVGAASGYPVADYLDKLKKYMEIVTKGKGSRNTKSLCWFYYYMMKAGYMYANIDKNGFYEIMETVNLQIETYKSGLRTRYELDFYSMISRIYFEFGNYSISLEWLMRFINHKDAQTFEEYYHNAIIFSIIIHYELKNLDLAEYLLNNTKRYYKKEEKLYISEKVFLKYLKMLVKNDSKEEILYIFSQLKSEIQTLKTISSERRFLNAFDFERWVDKNLEKMA